MIYLVTGETGAGKTAHVVDMIAHDDQFKNRPLFVMGIPELSIEHQPCPPVAEWTHKRPDPDDPSLELDYFTFPEDAIIILDEAQRVYRPRALGSPVPPHSAAFETHRHCGIDFFLITQVHTQIDTHTRKLTNRHIHIRQTFFGRQRLEWMGLGDPDSKTSREIAAKSDYTLPKRAFSLYKSSQRHTHIKKRIPAYAYLFAAASLATLGIGYYGYTRIAGKLEPVALTPSMHDNHAPGSQQDKPEIKTALEYMQERQPRIIGMAHTAPVYDEITKPVDAPWIAGCYKFRDQCKCKDQQGNHYETTESICLAFLKRGIFKDWESNQRDKASEQRAAVPRPEPASLEPSPQVLLLDDTHRNPKT